MTWLTHLLGGAQILVLIATTNCDSVKTRRALSSPLGPVIDLGYAAFAGNMSSPTGIIDGPVTFFGGIPYARPPVGNFRFRAPAMLNENAVTREVTDARNWGSACVQRPAVVGIGSEDCLTLNIWKPTNASENAKLPVIVYIHGGGFYANTPQGFPLYDWVAQHPTGIVGVSITYRLGLLGFLGGAAVAADGNLNAGLLDQRAGLEWVQRHIIQFGGNPDNVTISGESAGGASMMMQAVAYAGSRPVPFKRVIAQSIGFGPTRTQIQIEETFKNAVGYVGCPYGSTSTMSCLRRASLGAIVSAINRTPNGEFAPVVEGPLGFLPNLPSRLISAGKFIPVDYLGGHCTGDGKTFAVGRPTQFVTDDDIRRLVFSRWPGVSNATINKALALYPAPDVAGSPFPTQWDRAWTMAGEIVFACMDSFFAESVLKKGAKNVFSYSWNAPDTVLYNANPYLGAMHTSDLYYLFSGTNTFANAGNTFTPFNTSETLLSKEAIAYWTSFVANGDPTVERKEASTPWLKFVADDDSRQRMVLTRGDDIFTSSAMEKITTGEAARCQFWMSDAVVEETRI